MPYPFFHSWHSVCSLLGMVIAALVVGAGVLIELCAVLGAPLGYQDDQGFHVGDKKIAHAKDHQN